MLPLRDVFRIIQLKRRIHHLPRLGGFRHLFSLLVNPCPFIGESSALDVYVIVFGLRLKSRRLLVIAADGIQRLIQFLLALLKSGGHFFVTAQI